MPSDQKTLHPHEATASIRSEIGPPAEQSQKMEAAQKQEINNEDGQNDEEDSGHVQHTMLQVVMLNIGLCVGIFIICLDTTILG